MPMLRGVLELFVTIHCVMTFVGNNEKKGFSNGQVSAHERT